MILAGTVSVCVQPLLRLPMPASDGESASTGDHSTSVVSSVINLDIIFQLYIVV